MRTNDAQPDERLKRRFLLFAVAASSLLFLWMIDDFLMALLLGALAASLSAPVHRRLVRWLGGRRGLASALVVLGLVVLVIGPLSTLLAVVVAQAVQVTQAIGPWIEARIADPDGTTLWIRGLPIFEWLPIDSMLPERERLIEAGGNAVQAAGRLLIDGLAAAGRGTATFLLQVFIFLYAAFFFLLSGSETLERILELSPLEADDEAILIERFVSVTRATLRGSLLIGGIQGALAGIGFAVAGVPGAAFWGTIVVVLSVVPGIGAPLVWVPASLWLFATGETFAALGLVAWSALAVGSVDNVLRPRLVGSDARMSDLMIMISTLGGISLFGPAGFVVGPIVAAVFVTLWDVYGRVFADVLPAVALATDESESGGAGPTPGETD